MACISQESEPCTYESVPLSCAESCPPATTVNHELYNHCGESFTSRNICVKNIYRTAGGVSHRDY